MPCSLVAHCKIATHFAKRCWPIAITLCNAKVNIDKHGTMLQCTMVRKWIPLHQQCGVWFLIVLWRHQTLCEWKQQEICIGMSYNINTWLVKLGTNLFREEVLVFEDAKIPKCNRGTHFRLCRMLLTIPTLPIIQSLLHLPPNPEAQPAPRFSKIVRHTL